MSSIAVIAPIRYGAYAEVRRLIGLGSPFGSGRIYLTGSEAVFVFEGTNARAAAEELIGEAFTSQAALAWRRCLAGRPRIADGLREVT